MSDATTVLLVRHGETDWNREHRWQGHADPSLNAVGRDQARTLAARISADAPQAVYSSDLSRARETAEVVAQHLGVGVTLTPKLREVDVGEWSGLTSAQIAERYPDGLRRHDAGQEGWSEGESYSEMTERVLEAVCEIARAHPGERVVVVTHGGPMRSVWVAAGGSATPRRRFRNCEIEGFAVLSGDIRRIHS